MDKTLEEQLIELQNKQFMLNMKDTWDSIDYKYDDKLTEEIKKIKERINGK